MRCLKVINNRLYIKEWSEILCLVLFIFYVTFHFNMTSKTFLLIYLFTISTMVYAFAPNNDWWKHCVIYQIYPRSFKDSNGDGVGDLQGIINKLEHLQDAGITAAWLSPIYKSPQVDGGYDISDYRDIHEEYGTMADFEELIKKANTMGIKIIMDFVPNHTSNLHEWFIKSENREPGYEDYYVWADGPNNDDKTPPNNWISVFKYSAWQYSSIRKQWYLHQFTQEQPDLNFKNNKVVDEMKEILSFWMNKGVYGFRIDAVPHLFENGMLDEPLNEKSNANKYEYDYLDHIYTKDQPETFDLIYEFRDYIDSYNIEHSDQDVRILMTEAYSSITNTMKYYTNGKRMGAHFAFNFQLISINASTTAGDIVHLVLDWIGHLPSGCISNWVIGNHDTHRIATRVGASRVDGFNMLVAMLPGVAVTYNGEEIGMENGNVTFEEGQDPNARVLDTFNDISRDFERTPYHWDATKNAGFSDAYKTWLPVSEKYVNNNLALQKIQNNSHYKIYQQLIKLKKNEGTIERGDLDINYINNVIAVRRFEVGRNYIFVFNLGTEDENINLNELFKYMPYKLEILVSSIDRKGDLDSVNILLKPDEALIASGNK